MWRRLSFGVLISVVLLIGCKDESPTGANGNGEEGWVNNPPYTPSNPSPSNGAMGVNKYADLSWTGGDQDAGSIVKYTVYFGTNSTPPLVSSDQSNTTYDPGTMTGTTKYYWRVMAKDDSGATATSSIWSFTVYGAYRSQWNWINSEWSVSPGYYKYAGPYSLEAGDSLSITVWNVYNNITHLFCCTQGNFVKWQAGNPAYYIFSKSISSGGSYNGKVKVPSTDQYYFVEDNTGSGFLTVTFDLKVDVIRWFWYK